MSYSYSYNPEIWSALITLALAIYLGAYSWRRRNIPAAKPFAVACFMGGIWAVGVVFELSALDFTTKVFWVKFQAIWQLPIVTAVTCFLFQYAGLERWLTPRNLILLSIFPLLSVLAMVTNDAHHLVWTGFRMSRYVIASPGRLYWFFNSYIYLLGLVNFVVLVRLAVYSPRHRLPVAIILTGQIIGRVGYTLDKLETGLFGPGESLLFTAGLVGSAYAFALTRLNIIDPAAAARKTVLRQMREGLFVLDLQGRIVDANPMAAEIMGIPEYSLREKRFKELMPMAAEVLENNDHKDILSTDIIFEKDKFKRHYNLNLTPLRGRKGELVGQLLLLHDVTDQKQAQTQLLEQQSVLAMLKERERLARELHDGIGQVLGYLGIQAQTAIKLMCDGKQEKAASVLNRLVEVAKDAHADVRKSIQDLRTGSGKEWSFIPALKEYIDRFQSNYGIRTELSISERIRETTIDPAAGAHLLRVIQEALTNARKHSGAHTLKVNMQPDTTSVRITISDNGQGFDHSRLDHSDGNHFGLVFMRERMAQIGGSLKIDSIPVGGTVLKLEVPINKNGKKIHESASG
jgi:PAS domain S-box-containing protein